MYNSFYPDVVIGEAEEAQMEHLRILSLKINIIPQTILISIEIIQIYFDGWTYFKGWNVIDLINLTTFFIYANLRFARILENGEIEEVILKVLLLMVGFMKLLFYVRIYDSFGFLLSMLYSCILDLIPFALFYFTLLAIITASLTELGEEVSVEMPAL